MGGREAPDKFLQKSEGQGVSFSPFLLFVNVLAYNFSSDFFASF
jgi:hypothetical protein